MSNRVWDKSSARKPYRGTTDRTIHILLLPHKDKRGAAAARQRLLKDGMTIDEYIQAVRKDAERLARLDISYGVAGGFIGLLSPTAFAAAR